MIDVWFSASRVLARMPLDPEQREECTVTVGTGSQPSWRRRLAAAAGGAALTAVFLVPVNPAGAATTVGAQLTLSGVATASSPTGGTTVGVHPGDSVKITASSVPTAGAGPLAGLLAGVLGSVAGLEIDVTGLPGQHNPVKLSSPVLGVTGSTACPGTQPSVTLPALKAGTYNFTYTVKTATLLSLVFGCKAALHLNGDQIKTLTHNGVAVDATNVYHGVIVAAKDPPQGGISIQLPGVTVSGHVGPVKLPSVNLPGVSLPTIPITIPGLPGLDPTALAKARAAAAAAAKQALARKSQQQAYNFPGCPSRIPDLVVPAAPAGTSRRPAWAPTAPRTRSPAPTCRAAGRPSTSRLRWPPVPRPPVAGAAAGAARTASAGPGPTCVRQHRGRPGTGPALGQPAAPAERRRGRRADRAGLRFHHPPGAGPHRRRVLTSPAQRRPERRFRPISDRAGPDGKLTRFVPGRFRSL